MKIGFILDDTLDSTDGVQQYVLALGGAFTEQGHEVHYIVGQTKRHDIKNIHSLSKNITVSFNKNRMSTPLPTSKRKIVKLLKKHMFDVLHVQMPYSPFYGGRVISSASLMGIPTVGTFHILPASNTEKNGMSLLARVQSRSFSRLSEVLAVSKPAADCVKELYRRNSRVIPNPVDVTRYMPTKTVEQNNIVFVGRLVERKGCNELLHAIAWLNNRNYLGSSKVIICGDGPLLHSLKTFVRLHDLHDVVEFQGRVSESEKIKQLQNAQIAVFPSLSGESFGIVLTEAMAAGVGVVLAGDNPGYRSVMEGRSQQLVDPKNTEVFAAQIKHYLDNPDARKKAYVWQQKRVKMFDIPVVATAVLDVYQDVIANSLNPHHNNNHKQRKL